MKNYTFTLFLASLLWPLQPCAANNGELALNLSEFKRFFKYSINIQETAELELRLAPEFLMQFPDDCLLSATVSAVFDSRYNEKYIASSNLSRQPASVFASFSLYISGITDDVDIVLNYYLAECKFAEALDKNPTTTTFQIKNIGVFLKGNIGD